MFPHQAYEDRIVAFIDILGFSDMVAGTEADVHKLRHLTTALDELYNKIWLWEADGSYSPFAFTQFSDSIVISSLADSPDSFEMLMQLLIGIMELVDKYDILVRGGIARGSLIHDTTMLVGPAMVRAYELESKKAVYPRIILEKGLKEQLEADVEDYIKNHLHLPEVPEQNNLFKTDDDGWCYLNYINPPSCYNIELGQRDHLKALENLAKKGLQSTDDRIRTKYKWLQNKVEKAREGTLKL